MASVPVSPAVQNALDDLKGRLARAFGERFRELRLFGSMARGEAGPDSDVDLPILLDALRSHTDRTTAMDVAADVALEHELPLECLVLDEAELERLHRLETALARALDLEGVSL
jgi:uncharacterized protein